MNKEWKDCNTKEKVSAIYFVIVVWVGIYYTTEWMMRVITYVTLKLFPEKKKKKHKKKDKSESEFGFAKWE